MDNPCPTTFGDAGPIPVTVTDHASGESEQLVGPYFGSFDDDKPALVLYADPTFSAILTPGDNDYSFMGDTPYD